MEISYKPLEKVKTKKVSFNVEVQALELADDLAKLMNMSRTNVLMILVGLGTSPYMKALKDAWKGLKKSNPDKKAKIDLLLKKLSRIENKHVKRSY